VTVLLESISELRCLMLESIEGFIALGFFNNPAGLDLIYNMLTSITSVTIHDPFIT
jgi:hypothetical protein